MKIIIHTDGGARGNPGPAAVGAVIEKDYGLGVNPKNRNETISEVCQKIGETTNNVAEYTAVIKALEEVKKFQEKFISQSENLEIHFYLDSTLVVNQLNGLFKIKEPTLRQLIMKVHLLEQEVGGEVRYTYVPREQNKRADLLVNLALDNLR